MALRRRGKNNLYHAYFRKTVAQADGSLKYVTTTVNLGTEDLITARALEAELMRKNTAARMHQRMKSHMVNLEIAAGERPPEDLPRVAARSKRKRRLKLAAALEAAEKYRSIGETSRKHWLSFVRRIGLRYMDEVTPEIAFHYLDERDGSSGKTFNNLKSALNGIFRLVLLEAGLDESPFAKIPNRKNASKHQRPLSEAEFQEIYRAAPEPWKTASLIAWFTGLRQKDVFLLQWNDISGDVITTRPGKTARFGRSVQIPIHPQLADALQQLPKVSNRVLGAWLYEPKKQPFRMAFGKLLRRLKIKDNEYGIVNFNSFRNSFITRCDEHHVPRHATRGVVGQVTDNQTDLYSHDLASARLIQSLPPVKLDKS